MGAVSGYVTALSEEDEVTEVKCIWQDASSQMRSQPPRHVQCTAIHQLVLCGSDISAVKAKIAPAKVTWNLVLHKLQYSPQKREKTKLRNNK